jgi:iron complex outermembrane receptor protein
MHRLPLIPENRFIRPHAFAVLAAVAALLGSAVGPANAQSANSGNIANASIEDLMNMDVTSVSKKDQTLSETGAAVFVIGKEDIRRSGAANIPDLLRMVPGVEVAQINANQWAISIRGFNAVYSNKVLVLIDGRSVYGDQFSGVYWDQIDVPLENIERIEVIRGPGGTVWGANAVNGVINIITATAADTKGGLVVAGAGTAQNAAGLLQYGGDAGSNGAYRVFAKYFDDSNSPFPAGRTAPDGAHNLHGGFRVDLSVTPNDTLSMQGDFINEAAGESSVFFTANPPSRQSVTRILPDSSGDLLATWDHTLSNGSVTTLRVSDGAIDRIQFGDRNFDNSLDVAFEHHLKIGSRHDVVWGLDYRSVIESSRPTETWGIQVDPGRRATNLFAGFVQDEIRIAPSIFLTVGSKIEHNAYTGLEYEPGVQLVWTKSARQSVWASAARSIREPNISERDVRNLDIATVASPYFGEAPVVVSDGPGLRAEVLDDYEIGYRTQMTSRLSLDFTGFLSYYHDLVTYEAGMPVLSSQGILIIPDSTANDGKARDYGVEAFGNWQARRNWKISPGVSFLRMRVGGDPTTTDVSLLQTPGDSPREQFEIRSLLSLPRNLEWDSSLKYVTALPSQNIPGYTRFDMRLGWKVGERTEFSVSGQNLTSARHFEFVDISNLYAASEVARSVFGKLTWRF